MSSVIELMVSGSLGRPAYLIDSAEATPIKASVDKEFGPQNWPAFVGISYESDSPVGGAQVVTAYYHIVPDYIAKTGIRMARRKFCFGNKTVHEKLIDFVGYDSSNAPALPSSAEIIAMSDNHALAGYGMDMSVEQFADIYFYADPAECEKFFGLEETRGHWQTSYGVTFDKQTREVVRVKVYCYDNADICPNWGSIKTFALSVHDNPNA